MSVFAGENASLHSSGMDYPTILQGMMERGKLNQNGLAKRLKTKQPTISRLLKGTQPKVGLHERIVAEATRLGVLGGQQDARDPTEPDESAPPTVKVKGYVGAAAEAHFYAVSQGDLDEVPAPEGTTPDTVAVEIRGTSLGPLFDRWLVFYDDVRRPVTQDLIGHLCVIGTETGQVLVKKIKRSRARGLFTLVSGKEGEPAIEDVAIEWAARVKTMVPR